MDNQEQRIFRLLEKYEQELATDQEVRELEAWYQTFEDRPDIMAGLSDVEKLRARESMLNRLTVIIPDHVKGDTAQTKKPVQLWPRWTVAASLLIMLSVGGYFVLHKDQPETAYSEVLKQDFTPGSNKAILTLSGGKQIILADAKNGQLATQGGSAIQKKANGEVVYNSQSTDAVAIMNTMSTPRGGQYHLTLADGTGVWLNAASSITYPSGFSGNQRQVEITGEVYFEVAHNAAKPFLVKSGSQMVEVLGTHFNINAYADENQIKTTLLEGSVAITSADNRQILKPGQQAVFNGNSLKISDTDTDEAIAWKEGYFQFADADIETVMRQISRWYDVDVVFEGPVTKQTFTGRVSRFRNISKVLKIVQSYGDVTLVYEGRRIMVR
jgi:ferric-dicitrate binding protein FerR (iron transport regulator)